MGWCKAIKKPCRKTISLLSRFLKQGGGVLLTAREHKLLRSVNGMQEVILKLAQGYAAGPIILWVNKKGPDQIYDRDLSKQGGGLLSHQSAVPSAQTGLTSLFGMVRGEPRRQSHPNCELAVAVSSVGRGLPTVTAYCQLQLSLHIL